MRRWLPRAALPALTLLAASGCLVEFPAPADEADQTPIVAPADARGLPPPPRDATPPAPGRDARPPVPDAARQPDAAPPPCPDADGDGTCDADDRCPGGADDIDGDADGLPDTCDRCPADPANDADGDDVCAPLDICPEGPDDADFDFDGTPDDCDVCPADAFDDSDGDGVCGDQDRCPGGDDTVDADADGLPDACDPCPVDGPGGPQVVEPVTDGVVRIEEISIGRQRHVAIAAPGQPVRVSFRFAVADCPCPTCYSWLEVGFGDAPGHLYCAHVGVPGCRADPVRLFSQRWITAPAAPGVYPLRYKLRHDYTCDGPRGDDPTWFRGIGPPAEATIGYLCVPP